LDVCHIHRRFLQNNKTRFREHQLGCGAVQVELPNERALAIPDINTIPATGINVALGVKLNAIGYTGVSVGEHSTVHERLRRWVNVELIALECA